MTFADELRSIYGQGEPEPKPTLDYYTSSKVIPNLVVSIQNGCRARSREGLRSEAGYLHFWSGPDYDEGFEYTRKLPTIEQSIREAEAYNAARHSSAKDLSRTFVTEQSLYENAITTFKDAGQAKLVAEGLRSALSDKGFARLNVRVVKLDNIIIIRRYKTSSLMGRKSIKVTSKSDSNPLYAVYFEVSW